MPTIAVLVDVHDWTRLRDICTVRYERPMGQGAEVARDKYHISRGEVLRRLVAHAARWPALLPKMELPPVVGARRPWCVKLSADERQTMKRLAAGRRWTLADLARALIWYHWQLRETYNQAVPALRYRDYTGRWTFDSLSFAPDREQPWYYHRSEATENLRARAKADQKHLAETLLAGGVAPALIQQVIEDLENADAVRATYEWDEEYISPEQMRRNEYKHDGGLA